MMPDRLPVDKPAGRECNGGRKLEVRVYRVFRLLPLVLLLVPACAKKHDPGVPVRPFVDVANDRVCIGTVAGDPRGGIVRYVFALDGTPADSTAFLASGETAWSRIAIPDSGSLRVRALCRNSFGLSSDWSEELVYQLSAPPARRDTDVYWSPWDTTWFVRPWGRERWYRVGFNVTDPDGDSVAVKFLWDDGRSSGWSAFMPSGSDVIDSVMYVTDGDHYVRVLVKDRGGTITGPDTIACLRVSEIALLWSMPELGSDVSPTLATYPYLRCYTNDGEGVYCIGRDGTIVWSTPVDCDDSPMPLSLDGTRIYCINCENISCLDAVSGNIIWRLSVDVVCSFLAVGPAGELYAISYSGLCRIRDDGDSAVVEWDSEPLFYEAYGIAISRDSTVYVTASVETDEAGAVAAYRPDGTLLWCDSTLSYCDAPPVIDGLGRVIVVGDINDVTQICCYTAAGGKAWSIERPDLWSTCVVGNQNETYWSLDSRMLCLSPDGRVVWEADVDEGAEAPPCVASDGAVLNWSSNYCLTCISRFGEPLWAYSVQDTLYRYFEYRLRVRDDGEFMSSPAIGPDGNVYLDMGDAVGCIAIGRRTLGRTPWPAAYHDAARSGWAGRTW
jgi:hypothetical protein